MRAFRLMGIVNVTPDSFFDGGRYLDAEAAVAHGLELARQGADILDVGGESTRPGAEPVAADEELRRVLPAVEGLVAGLARAGSAGFDDAGSGGFDDAGSGGFDDAGSGGFDGVGAAGLDDASAPDLDRAGAPGRASVQISIDTSKASVARSALAAGATLVNDVTALRGDVEMAGVLAAAGCDCCLMHMRGEPRTMQRPGGPRYDEVVGEVKAFLAERMAFAVAAGIAEQRILLDPGIGFGKTVAHNLELLRRLDELAALGRPIVIGTSRKSFLGPGERLAGTIATNVMALERGASVFRVHDVAPVAAALATAAATLGCT